MSVEDFTLTKEYLHEIFDYKEGQLYWKISCGNVIEGKKAGSLNDNRGYHKVQINNKKYLLHRIIFQMFYGYMPKILDHIDSNPSNNRIENLREATHSQNCFNRSKPIHNTSGIKGVNWHNSTKKWEVRVMIFGKRLNFGRFNNLELAELVAIEARDKYHGKFANNN